LRAGRGVWSIQQDEGGHEGSFAGGAKGAGSRAGVASGFAVCPNSNAFPKSGFLFAAKEGRLFVEGVRQPLCESSSITDGDRNASMRYSTGTKSCPDAGSGQKDDLG
jgi:hypothetical protein